MSSDVTKGVGIGCGIVFGVLAAVLLIVAGVVVLLCGGLASVDPAPVQPPPPVARVDEVQQPAPDSPDTPPEPPVVESPAPPVAPPMPLPAVMPAAEPKPETVDDSGERLRTALARAQDIETTDDLDAVAESLAAIIADYPDGDSTDATRFEAAALARLRLALHHAETYRDPTTMLRITIERHPGTVAAKVAERMLSAAPAMP